MESAENTALEDALLPEMLEALGQPAILLDAEHRVVSVNRRFANRFDRWRSGFDHRCFELLHGRSTPCDPEEVDCPLARALSEDRVVSAVHVHLSASHEHHVNVTTRPLRRSRHGARFALQMLEPIAISSPVAHPDLLVGRSACFNRMLEAIERVAPSKLPVLVRGEPGTGKEMVAKKIHELSERSRGRFVALDCSALRESLFEREAFGHARGAFSGAERSSGGLVGAANGGTLFLDEVEELPLGLQSKVLRLIESGRYRPEGGTDLVPVDLRLIGSTTIDLDRACARELFRPDLLLAISALSLRIPPLRDRLEDLPLLVESLLQRLSRSGQSSTITSEALEVLQSYDYPGNIRELGTVLERACVLSRSGPIGRRHLHLGLPSEHERQTREVRFCSEIRTLDELVRSYVRWAADSTEMTHVALAKRLGISERTLYRKLSPPRPAGASNDPGETAPSPPPPAATRRS